VNYAAAVLADLPGTGSFWKLDEASGALVDSGGGAHNSTDNTNLIYRQPGPLRDEGGYSLAFTANLPSTGFGAAIFEFLGTASYSLECWVNPSDLSGNPFIFRKDTAAEGWYTRILAAGGVRMVRLQASALDTLDSAAGKVVTGAWTHLVWTYDGTSMAIYVNGALVAGPTASAKSVQTNVTSVSFGGLSGAGNRLLGLGALPAIYPGVVLSLSQVQTHYTTAGLGSSYTPRRMPIGV
jgi:hypothetical protein